LSNAQTVPSKSDGDRKIRGIPDFVSAYLQKKPCGRRPDTPHKDLSRDLPENSLKVVMGD